MGTKEKSVQDITKLFEYNWRLAYPNEQTGDSNYKLHNYIRVLHPQLGQQVGVMNPKNYQHAKDIAYQIEAYMPRVPAARLNTCALTQEEDTGTNMVTQLSNILYL